jgi:hypothetical protein
MKETLNTYEIAYRLFRDENAGWSYNGAKALAEHLEQLEQDCGEEMEFDRVAIRCDYSEYPSALVAAREYGFDGSADLYDSDDQERDAEEVSEETEEMALDWLQDRTEVIGFDGGVIIRGF